MSSDSIVSLVPILRESFQKLVRKKREDDSDDNEVESEDRLVSTQWVIWGLFASVTFGTVTVWFVFGNEGIKPWATVAGFFMGTLLSILGYVPSIKDISC